VISLASEQRVFVFSGGGSKGMKREADVIRNNPNKKYLCREKRYLLPLQPSLIQT
jgi:hypothetical protein